MSRPKPTKTELARRKEAANQRSLVQDRARYAKERAEIIKLLGSRCPCGFHDPRALQIDHRFGGGSKWRKAGGSWPRLHKHIRQHPSLYRLLCACCNAIARIELGQNRKATRKSTS